MSELANQDPRRLPEPSHFANAAPLGGRRAVAVEIAGIRVEFTGLPEALAVAALQQYSRFLCTLPPEHMVSVRRGAPSYLPLPDDKYMSLETATTTEGKMMVSNHFAALRGAGSGILAVSEPEVLQHTLGAMENYLRWMVAETVIRRGGLVLHSAGIVCEGQAYVFFGHSGAGKSTVAALSAPLPALSDDLILLQKEAEGWRACATPFAGSFPQEKKALGSYPIAGLFALRKAMDVKVRPVARAVAAGMIASAVPFLSEQDRKKFLLPLLEDLCGAVPVHELLFRKDASFWNVVRTDRK